MKKTLAIAAFSLVAVVGLAGFRGCGHQHDGRDPAQLAAMATDRLDGLLDDLDATPAQRATIQGLKDQLLAQVQKLHAERQADHAALLAEWNAEHPDRAKIMALIDQRSAELTALAHQAADAAIQAHDVLTPEQRAKAAKKMERMHKHHGG
jgi:Spy/CpxP family protein refolding chaperone